MTRTTETPAPRMPGGLPVIGHALDLARRPLEFVEALRTHGSVVEFRLGTKPAYMVNTPGALRELLITQCDKFEKGGTFYNESAKFLGNGLATSKGEFHLRQRRLAQPAFRHDRMASYAVAISDAAAELAGSWHDGQVVDVSQDLYGLAVDFLSRTLFSGLPHDAETEIRNALPILVSGVARRAFLPIGFVHKLPLPINRREEAALRRLHHLVDRLITNYRTGEASDRGDLLSMLLLARDPATGQGMSDHQIHDEVLSMMVAGTESSATILCWAFHMLGENPAIERKLHAEVDHVLGGRAATYADLPKLEYVGRIIQEVLRMYPIAWLLTRRAVTDVNLDGHHIPAHANVFFSVYALHQDPTTFPDPKRFDPDRWLPERTHDIPRDSYLPFGAGVRKCIGEFLAYTELAIAFATITSTWKLIPLSEHPVRPVARSTLHPNASRMTVEKRAVTHGQT